MAPSGSVPTYREGGSRFHAQARGHHQDAHQVLGCGRQDRRGKQRARVAKINGEFARVFALTPDDLPPLMKDVEPHKFRLREGATPRYCRCPKWRPETRRDLSEWKDWAPAQGLVETAHTTPWAPRVVIAPKYRGDTSKGATPDDLSATRLWTQTAKWSSSCLRTRIHTPRCGAQVLRGAGWAKAIWSIPLHDHSKDVTSIWLPYKSGGVLYPFTRWDSDAAREFLAPAVASICDLLGCKRTTTLTHHPTGNAKTERVWMHVGKSLRQMTDDQHDSALGATPAADGHLQHYREPHPGRGTIHSGRWDTCENRGGQHRRA